MRIGLCNQLDMDLNLSSFVPSQLHVYGWAPHGYLITVILSPLIQSFSNIPMELHISIVVPQGL